MWGMTLHLFYTCELRRYRVKQLTAKWFKPSAFTGMPVCKRVHVTRVCYVHAGVCMHMYEPRDMFLHNGQGLYINHRNR